MFPSGLAGMGGTVGVNEGHGDGPGGTGYPFSNNNMSQGGYDQFGNQSEFPSKSRTQSQLRNL